MKRSNGFTLVESIMAMVILGFAMVTLVSFLYPQIERSATPHYQTRAANLGQSLMSQILARGFDNNSDFDGGQYRCDEPDRNGVANPCSTTLGRDSGESNPAQFNDVDDYIGCWWTDSTNDCGGSGDPLSNILGTEIASKYAHFTVTIDVNYDTATMKKIQIKIDTGRYGEFDFTGFRGNY